MPAELVKAFYDLKINSIIDIACGSGWICDYIPSGTKYLGFDKNQQAVNNAKKLHPEGEFVCTTIEAVVADMEAKLAYTERKFDCAFMKCVFCVIDKELVPQIVKIIEKMVTRYIFLYDTEKAPNFWVNEFMNAGFRLVFTHMRQSSYVQIWSV